MWFNYQPHPPSGALYVEYFVAPSISKDTEGSLPKMSTLLKDRKKSGNVKMLEDTLATQIAELKANLNDRDLQAAAKIGR